MEYFNRFLENEFRPEEFKILFNLDVKKRGVSLIDD